MAAKGYVVMYTNPRGDTTYGQASATSSSIVILATTIAIS